jgi:hypothetical protein
MPIINIKSIISIISIIIILYLICKISKINKTNKLEYYTYTDTNKEIFKKMIYEIYPLDIRFSWEATVGVIIIDKYYIALSNNRFSIYDRTFYNHIRTYKTPFTNIIGGTHYNAQLYFIVFENNTNYIKIMDIGGFGISVIDTVPIKLNNSLSVNNKQQTGQQSNLLSSAQLGQLGQLTWIDRFRTGFQHDDNLTRDAWWGLVNFEGKNIDKIKLIRFEDDFTIDKTWNLPDSILKRCYPYGISGGQFHRGTGLLFLIPYKVREIYVVYVDEDNPYNNVVDLIQVIYSPFESGSIQFETGYNNDYVWGINKSYNEVTVAKLYYK